MSPPLISKPFGFPLNTEQRSAVEHGEGPLLVVAGAGTGKTRVITERIRNLLESDPCLAGENILGLTFTDKAAGEMKHRVVEAIGERARGVWLGTFHSFCLEKILRERNPDIQPLEDIDHRILLRRNIAELGLVIFRRLAEPAEFLKDFQTFFSRCQDELVSPDDYQRYVDSLLRTYESHGQLLEPDARALTEQEIAQQQELARVYRVSDRLLRERHLCTFGAQLLQAVELLRTDAALLARIGDEYRYVLVDEFQDTNIAQLELLWLLAGGHRNILAVGDDDQAIYRFRGASFGSFTIFLERFCGVTTAQGSARAKQFLTSLSENYRSTQRILRVAAEAIAHNEKSPLLPLKNLTTQNVDGDKIRVVEFASAEEEAHWVASEIERLHRAGAAWRAFAVLYRKHRHRAQLLGALKHRQIPFVIRKSSILRTTIVRDLLAWLRLIAVFEDNIACARVLSAPYWAVEPRDLVRLAERAEKNRRSLWEEVKAAADERATSSPRPAGPRFADLVGWIDRLRQTAKTETAGAMLDRLIAGLEIAPLLSEIDRQHVDRLAEFVDAWQRKSEPKGLCDFVEYLDYFDELEGDIQIEEETSDDAVQLMTVHAAKGLEFPHVFLLRLSRHDFPSGARRPQFEFPAALMKEEQPKGDFQKQEERRLFYVALTRAQKRLTLSTIVGARKRPSPFLEDILGNPKIQKADVVQSAPSVAVPPSEERAAPPIASATAQAELFPATREGTRAYSRIAFWAQSYHPPRPEPLQLSASAIETYERCPMKYLFQYGWRLRSGPSASMTFGNVMHTTIREFVAESRKRALLSPAELLTIYEREWKSAGFPDQYQEEEYRKAGREQLEAFHRSFTAHPPDVLYQEKPFELRLEADLVVSGRIDQVNRLDQRKVEIVDYKTGKVRSQDKAADDIQLSIYALASSEAFDLEPERLVFHYLMSDEMITSRRDGRALDQAKERIAEIAGQIRAGDFQPKPGRNCGYCDFKPLCPAHEQLLTI